ncbi:MULTISPECIES: hypothetical protein [Sorangium]|uniref:Uncharacterized protein n=1 Tax=Sorangium cellulosum (strain So ce56) TaxID=448385 RepID=A9EW16_SORC5|nr:hypothetical protein [Sorangium cellulosum]CAN94278.1 hypothetical protein predicted by Glimmer/Critica [Sorangium cellulosum So ce56]
MSDPWARLRSALAEAEQAAIAMTIGPRCELMATHVAAARAEAARPSPSAAALAEVLQRAVVPALLEAVEVGELGELQDALGRAHAAALDAMASDRLAGAPGPAEAEGLTALTTSFPTVVAMKREPFARPWRPAASEAAGEDEAGAPPAPGADASPGGARLDDEGHEAQAEPLDVPPPPPRQAPDHPREDAPRPDPPPVRIDPAFRPAASSDLHARVVRDALDRLGAAARLRDDGPFSERAGCERDMLAASDAILVTSGDPIRTLLSAWLGEAEDARGYVTYAAVFALARIGGPDALQAVRAGLDALPPDAEAAAARAADALAVVPRPDLPLLAEDLVRDGSPVARAVGVELALRLDPAPARMLNAHLFDSSPVVLQAALRAAGRSRFNDVAPLFPLLERWLHFPHRQVAYLAALALLEGGSTAPYEQIVRGGRLAQILGPLALEILVLAGGARDKEAFARIARSAPLSPSTLSALGRFGHPEAWAIFLHALSDDALAEAAAEALATLFGPLVPPGAELDGPAWRAAIAALKPDPTVRLRRGKAWSAQVVAEEIDQGDLNRWSTAQRLRELAVRAQVEGRVDLAAWGHAPIDAVGAVTREARSVTSRRSSHGW